MGAKKGVSYSSGLVNIRSLPVKEGLSVFALGQVGHNTNEPGPWIFDPEQVTPNIDRLDRWLDAGFSLKVGNWYSRGLVRQLSFLNMNPFIQMRIRNLIGLPELGEWPDGRSTTQLGMAETGIKSRNFDLKIQGIRSDSDEFIFFQPLAWELPTAFTTE